MAPGSGDSPARPGARDLRGVFAPIPTPFEPASGELAWDRLAENVARWNRTSLAGLVVLGSNGEFVLLEESEKEALVARTRELAAPAKAVVAGTGCESTQATIRLTRACARAGADAVLVVTPHYYKGSMTDQALERYYLDVAEASPAPVLLYNMPRNTGLNLSPALVARLARHPNITGVKDSGGDIAQIAEIIRLVPPSFRVFAGSAGFFLATLALGGAGGTLATANIAPDECCAIQDLWESGRHEEARGLQFRLLPPNRAVTARWGIPGLKAAMDLLGWYGGPPRPPLLPLSETERAELRVILAEAGLADLSP
jgi:4-hydroxy-2-oxoglutarate aldolase